MISTHQLQHCNQSTLIDRAEFIIIRAIYITTQAPCVCWPFCCCWQLFVLQEQSPAKQSTLAFCYQHVSHTGAGKVCMGKETKAVSVWRVQWRETISLHLPPVIIPFGLHPPLPPPVPLHNGECSNTFSNAVWMAAVQFWTIFYLFF